MLHSSRICPRTAHGGSDLIAGRHSERVSIYEEVDIHPSFPGGDHKMYSFINSERRYPAKAYDAGIEGRVLISCIVEANGDISHIEVVKGVEDSLDREAVRIIESMPRWGARSYRRRAGRHLLPHPGAIPPLSPTLPHRSTIHSFTI